MEVKKSGLIHLTEDATNSMSEMLVELFKVDEHLKINHSKLASFILSLIFKNSWHISSNVKGWPLLFLLHMPYLKVKFFEAYCADCFKFSIQSI